VACGDGLKGGLEVGEGLDAVHLACLDQRGYAAPVFATFVVACEEGVLSVKGNRADCALNRVVIDFDPPIPMGKCDRLG